MLPPPFSATPEAAAWIARKLAVAREFRRQEAAVPVLIVAFDFRVYDRKGRLVEAFDGEFFDIGWDRPDSRHQDDHVALALGGGAVLALPSDIERLRGCVLSVETVDVGVPDPASKKRLVLRAAKRQTSPAASPDG